MNKEEGLIYKSTGSWYEMQDKDGRMWQGRIKGKMKIDPSIKSTNPIAVGDRVLFAVEDENANTAMINKVLARKNYIVRVSPHNRNHKHVVAANLDMALVIATIASPRTSLGFIDRFLITAEAYHIPAVVVVNKTDLLQPADQYQLDAWKAQYEQIGYPVWTVSAHQPETLQVLQQQLKDKTTLFSGHSGVGKSTLINQLLPDLGLRTMEVSDWSGKGQHTTTFAEMFDLPEGGRIIDTPGVKEFGLIDMEREVLAHYFPEMRAIMSQCRFNNCLHVNEPGCAVKEAVNAETTITRERYISYLSILDSIEKKW